MLRLLVVSRLRLHREGIAAALSAAGHRVVCSVGSGPEAVHHARAMRPDVAVLDLPRDESVTLVWALSEAAPSVKIVVAGVEPASEHIVALAEAGAAGYLPADGTAEELAVAVQRAARGESLCSPAVAGALMHRLAEHARPNDAHGLTVRERQVVGLLSQGLANKEIAARLCIETSTVKNHVHSILRKLDVHRRGEVLGRLEVPARAGDPVGDARR